LYKEAICSERGAGAARFFCIFLEVIYREPNMVFDKKSIEKLCLLSEEQKKTKQ
jgi:hypothetical protein